MAAKCYISNLSGEWSHERQLEVLGDLANEFSVYADKLSLVARKERRAVALKDRAALLASFRDGEGDELHVASWACLALGPDDLITLTAETDRLGVTIVVHDVDQRFEPGASPAKMRDARDALADAKRSRNTETPREAAARRRRERTEKRIALIREDWPKPSAEFSTKDLLARAGEKGRPMAYETARQHLGHRPEKQDKHASELAREEGRRLARERRQAKKGDAK